MRQPNLKNMNQYNQALMTGQFSPAHFMMQNRQAQNFTPQQPVPLMPIPGQGQQGQGNMAGFQKLIDMIDQKQKQGVADQVAAAGLPAVLPQQMSGLEKLKFLPQAGYGFAR